MFAKLLKWNSSQITWYLELLIRAIGSDRSVSATEMQLISQVFRYLKVDGERKRLMQMLENEAQPESPLVTPPDLSGSELGAAFADVALLLIADCEYSDDERLYLENLARSFGFAERFFNGLMEWVAQGFHWKQGQLELVRQCVPEGEHLTEAITPVHLLNSEQKLWYAEVLLSAILADGVVEQDEVYLLKTLLGWIESPVDKNRLVELAKARQKPPLSRPQGIKPSILQLIYLEVLYHFVFNGLFGEKEREFAKQLATACQLSDSFVEKGYEWWHEGVEWKKGANMLLNQAEFNLGRRAAPQG